MDKKQIISAAGTLVIYAAAAWLVSHPEELGLLKPRALLLSAKTCRLAAEQTANVAHFFGLMGMEAELAYSKAINAAKP